MIPDVSVTCTRGHARSNRLQHRRNVGLDDVVGTPDAHLALVVRLAHQAPQRVVHRHHRLGVRQQPLTCGGRAQGAIGAIEQLDAEQLFEALQLLADGRLREIQKVAPHA